MSKQYDYQEEEGEIFCREDQFLGEDLELMKKFQTSYPNQFHLHLLNINIKDHIEIQDGVKTTQEPEPKIFWNSNALIPAQSSSNKLEGEGIYQQLLMEKHEFVFSESLKYLYQEQYFLGHNNWQAAKSEESYKGLHLQQIIQNLYFVEEETKYSIKQIVRKDHDSKKILKTILQLSPQEVKEKTLFIGIQIIIYLKNKGLPDNLSLNSQFFNEFCHIFIKKYLPLFKYDEGKKQFEDKLCELVLSWEYTIYLILKGNFQNQLYCKLKKFKAKVEMIEEIEVKPKQKNQIFQVKAERIFKNFRKRFKVKRRKRRNK